MIDLLALLAGLAVGALLVVAILGFRRDRAPLPVAGPAPAPYRPQPSATPAPAPPIRVNQPAPAAAPAGSTQPIHPSPPPAAAAPAPGRPVAARLDLDDGSDGVVLGDETVTMGRGTDQRLRIPDSRASRAHALVRRRAKGGWELKDAGSANGTQLNGHTIPEGRVAPLRHGDRIGIGPITITYTETTGPPAPQDQGPPPDPDATRIA